MRSRGLSFGDGRSIVRGGELGQHVVGRRLDDRRGDGIGTRRSRGVGRADGIGRRLVDAMTGEQAHTLVAQLHPQAAEATGQYQQHQEHTETRGQQLPRRIGDEPPRATQVERTEERATERCPSPPMTALMKTLKLSPVV